MGVPRPCRQEVGGQEVGGGTGTTSTTPRDRSGGGSRLQTKNGDSLLSPPVRH